MKVLYFKEPSSISVLELVHPVSSLICCHKSFLGALVTLASFDTSSFLATTISSSSEECLVL